MIKKRTEKKELKSEENGRIENLMKKNRQMLAKLHRVRGRQKREKRRTVDRMLKRIKEMIGGRLMN